MSIPTHVRYRVSNSKGITTYTYLPSATATASLNE